MNFGNNFTIQSAQIGTFGIKIFSALFIVPCNNLIKNIYTIIFYNNLTINKIFLIKKKFHWNYKDEILPMFT